jgi:hypothetical protein
MICVFLPIYCALGIGITELDDIDRCCIYFALYYCIIENVPLQDESIVVSFKKLIIF